MRVVPTRHCLVRKAMQEFARPGAKPGGTLDAGVVQDAIVTEQVVSKPDVAVKSKNIYI